MENTLNIDNTNTTALTKISLFFTHKQRIRAYVDSCLCFAVAASLKFNESCVRIRIARRLCGNPAVARNYKGLRNHFIELSYYT